MALTPDERIFVDVILSTGSSKKATNASGISVQKAIHNRAILKATRDGMQAQLLSAAPQALSVLVRLATDETIPAAVRRLAASDILDRAGVVSQTALQLAQPIENLSEMPAKNLRALVERLETELFARSTPVKALEFDASFDTANDANPLSILD